MGSNQVANLIQKILWIGTGEEVDKSFMREATYVETIDLSGPRLSILFDDPDSILTDSDWFQIKIGDILKVTFEDPTYRSGMNMTLKFVILTMPKDGSILTFHCFQEDVYRLKMPAKEAQLFVQKSVRDILYSLIPGLPAGRIEDFIDDFPVVEDYHLLPGMRPSLMIRQMAREQGALVFFSRNKFYFKTLYELRDGALVNERIEYEYNNNMADNQITHMEVMNVDQIIGDRIVREYLGWHMEDGYTKGECDYPNAPVEFVGVAHKITLSNLLAFALPLLDLTMIGDGRLEPGVPLDFVWNVSDSVRLFDDSLPVEGVVGVISHYCTGDQYNCRAKIVIPLDESQLM